MIQVIPAIITETSKGLRDKFSVARGITEWVQVDIMDGVFVPPKTWPYEEGSPEEIASFKSGLKVEAHFMVSKPETILDEWMHAGIDRAIVHYESTEELGVIIDTLKNHSIECGIALNLETPIEVIEPWVGDISVLQLMAISEIGYHGRPFDMAVIPKLQALRLKYPELTIQVDGGVTLENALRLMECGVDGVVVGGAIFHAAEPRNALVEFKHTLETTEL